MPLKKHHHATPHFFTVTSHFPAFPALLTVFFTSKKDTLLISVIPLLTKVINAINNLNNNFFNNSRS